MKKRIFTLGLLGVILLMFTDNAYTQCCVAPSNLVVKSIGKTEADLQWDRVTQAGCTTPVKYKVQYRVKGTTTWTSVTVKTHADDTHGDTTITNLTPLTKYEWRVQGICSSTSKTNFVTGPKFTTLAPVLPSPVASSSAQDKLAVTVSPNPVTSVLNLTGHVKENGAVKIEIVSQTGLTVFNKSYNFNSYDFNTSIDVSNFQKGMYMIMVSSTTEKVSLTIMKE